MRSSSSPFTNPSGLVDKRLQPMWDQIEQVRALLPQIAHVSYYMESIFNLDRNLSLLADENVDHHILKDIQIFQGANAYEIALAEGYVGDVTSWLTSLKGPKGDTGLLDEAAHLVLTNGIAANAAAAAAAQATADANTATFSSYVPLSTYNARVAYVDGVISNLNSTITSVVGPLLPTVRTDTEITNLAQAAINNSLATVNSSLGVLGSRLDGVDIDLINIQTGLNDTSTAFGSFLISHNNTLTRIDVLEADALSFNTSIISLQTVSATQATNITALQATSATHQANIISLQTVTADAATQINNLQVSNNANNALILTEQSARVSALEAAAVDRALIRTQFATADSQVLTDAEALVATETSARTTALNAAASDRTLIRTEFAAADSGLQTQINNRATITQLNTVESDAASARAAIAANLTAETTNRINADTALQNDINTRATNTRVDTVESDAVSARAALSLSLTTAYQTADAGLQTQINNRATITYVDTAISTETSARTSSINTLTSTVNGLSSTVSTQGNTIATIDGKLNASYGLTVDANGRIASMKLLSNGTTSEIAFTADSFKIFNGVSNQAIFTVEGGNVKVNGNLVINGSINSTQIASNAVTQSNAAYTEGTTGGTAVGDGWTRYQSVTITTTGGPLLITAALKGIIASDTFNASQGVRIRRGTTGLYTCNPFNSVVTSGDTVIPFSTTIIDQPAAGTYTYYLETTFSGADISRNEISNRTLSVTELKR